MRVPTTKLQNSFGKYLKYVLDGKEVIITKNSKGVAKLVRYTDPNYGMVKEGAVDYSKSYITYDEFIKITENSDNRYELIDGQIYLMASPSHVHQNIIREISGQMYIYFSDKPCDNFTSPYDVKLFNDSECFKDDPNVVQPDILVICDFENVDENDRYQGIPSLVVEVLSKSTRSKDMVLKLQLYMKSGVSEYWIVDPFENSVRIYYFKNRLVEETVLYRMGEDLKSFVFKDLVVKTDKLI
ncbi:type II toxin-antitoxin system prevent-host-death family antitoxin [Acidaminobacter sp. JC074]|uniref:type II toxin-antitoxin system prevent-host-death family antitoxin n=1 Tax=Acidaminobacter sp. JC074 TaxID=2530199 RepID=UPI001F107DFF|nr:type II toxin-antitoxin system prevent-host-death family antitoxin [Acidaminobacter sp. JC074]MCH4887895.1 type II toxin-antitoxin system prevent-host-death family antitoxin [Acidaminobacter sp. JC074]